MWLNQITVRVCVCACVRKWVCTSSWSEAAALGAHMFQARNGKDWDPTAATGCQSPAAGKIHVIHMYIFPPAHVCTAQQERNQDEEAELIFSILLIFQLTQAVEFCFKDYLHTVLNGLFLLF